MDISKLLVYLHHQTQTTMYTLTLQTEKTSTKEFSTLELAVKFYDRMISIIRTKQANYDTVQLVDYIAIDSNTEMDIVYCDGAKLMDSALRMGR